jgi:uncharacterized protein with von Willebrand factor type A (vWA) domain
MTQAGAGTVEALVGFGRTLRAAGVAAGPDRVQSMVAALAHLDVAHRDDVYWAGRLTLCGSPDDIRRYDRAFLAAFSEDGPDRAQPGDTAEERQLAVAASRSELLRQRDLARLTSAERDEVRRLIALLDPVGPARVSRRLRPAHRGPLDAGRTMRATLRRGGETARLLHRARSRRPRRLVFLVDVSGSMAPYADALLRFAHAAASRRPRTEVFTIGTRLTRVTRELHSRDPDTALAALSGAVLDWRGGTRLGDLLKAFLDGWGQRGMARGAVVVVASDGWERGDASLLGQQMARLARLAHRVVWVNPHRGRPGYQPLAAGMAAALPHVDEFVAGHTLAAMEELCAVLSAPHSPDRAVTRGAHRA